MARENFFECRMQPAGERQIGIHHCSPYNLLSPASRLRAVAVGDCGPSTRRDASSHAGDRNLPVKLTLLVSFFRVCRENPSSAPLVAARQALEGGLVFAQQLGFTRYRVEADFPAIVRGALGAGAGAAGEMVHERELD